MSQEIALTGSDELEQFYREKFYFSYSSINKLLYAPTAFYNHYILNQREDSTDAHLIAGRALHCLLLEPDKFDDFFIVLPGKMPQGNNKLIVDAIFKYHCKIGNNSLDLEDYSQEILTQLLSINLHQALKTDQQRLEKILTQENKDYFKFLKDSIGRSVIDQETLDGCKVSVELLKTNPTVRTLLQIDKDENDTHITVKNEMTIHLNVEGLPFGFKGVLDNIVIDYEAKIIFINDLKTTSKSIQDFPESVEYYKYWIQAVMYSKLAEIFAEGYSDEWTMQITFIVIDKYNQVYPFQVSPETLAQWKERFQDVVKQLRWHYEHRRFDLPYELALGNIKL